MPRLPYLLTLAVGTSLFYNHANAQRNSSPGDDTCRIEISTEAIDMVPGQYTARRRVMYDTTKRILSDQYDATMYALGLAWGDKKEDCHANVENMNVYYHGVVVPGGAYVIDSSEEQSTNGRAAHDCLLGYFTDLLVEKLGCELGGKKDKVE